MTAGVIEAPKETRSGEGDGEETENSALGRRRRHGGGRQSEEEEAA